ncbi:unnamed protein product [Linum trigynum]|uniref:Replication protein A OB domain-containing protein n=1 Tax=Linum trigynum TaxID=586398 RepID=A0AAV2GUA5_9ROSI
MDATLLCNLKGGTREVTLRLRLLHMRFAKNPSGTRGMLIQSLADVSIGSKFERVLRVGVIYVLRSFGLSAARNLYRACSFDLIIELSATTIFQACSLPAAEFPTDSFEVVPYSELSNRSGDNRILADVVGRLHSISGIDHQVTNHGSTPKQVLVLKNAQGQRVSITLWNELTAVLDRPALIQADSIEPVIIGVGGLMVGRLIAGEYSCSSSSGTRIVVSPRIPEAYSLAAFFGGSRVPVADLPVKFTTPGDAVADAERRTRTIAELLDLHYSGASVDEKHRCGGKNRSVDSRSPCYKIQLTLRDATDEAPFIIFGPCGNNLV